MEDKLVNFVRRISFGLITTDTGAKMTLVGVALIVILLNLFLTISATQPEPPSPHTTEHKNQREAGAKKAP